LRVVTDLLASVDDIVSLQQQVFNVDGADRFIVCFTDDQYLVGENSTAPGAV
jgi:hypothetical protein